MRLHSPADHMPKSYTPPDQVEASRANRTESNHEILRESALQLEAAFLTEMLKSAGFGKARDSYGGGAGEDQFGSLLVRAQAEQMARAGGIGLAESLFHSLLEAENGTASRTRSD